MHMIVPDIIDENLTMRKEALKNITTGYHNIGLGYFSLRSCLQGRNNIGFGYESLHNVQNGLSNIAIGYKAGKLIVHGDSNILIGNDANPSGDDTKEEIVIGFQATGMGDSTVVLGDSLKIKSTYLHGDVDINRAYVLPKTAGTSGQVLKYPVTGKMLEWGDDKIGGAGEMKKYSKS